MLGKYATARFGVIMGIVVSLCLVVALVCVFVLRPTPQTQNTTLDQSGQEFIEVEESYKEPSEAATENPYQPSGVNQGSVYWEQIESGYYELTAVAHRAEPEDDDQSSFVFAYWQTSSGTKISGDATIRVKTYTTGNAVTAREYVPVFIQETTSTGTSTNLVHYITNLPSINDEYFGQNGSAGHIYILQNDIVLDTSFNPIGYDSSSTTNYTAFAGVLDGNGHTIENLNINSGVQYVGIFCGLNGGVVKNLNIISGTISASNASASVGSIAGVMVNSLISRCENHAAIVASGSGGTAAGFVGTVNLTEQTINGALTSALYKNENYGAIRGNRVGAIVFLNNVFTDSNSGTSTPAAYLIQNVNQGSFQTDTANETSN